MLARPDGTALLADGRAASLLRQAQNPLELFRRAVELKNDGYFFGAKPEQFDPKTPPPSYGEHMRLFKLLLLDAKVASLRKQRPSAERDLLAVMGFLIQASEQKFGALYSGIVVQLCLQKGSIMLARSIQGSAPSDLYLKESSRRLNRLAENQDLMEAAYVEEGENSKGLTRHSLSPN